MEGMGAAGAIQMLIDRGVIPEALPGSPELLQTALERFAAWYADPENRKYHGLFNITTVEDLRQAYMISRDPAGHFGVLPTPPASLPSLGALSLSQETVAYVRSSQSPIPGTGA